MAEENKDSKEFQFVQEKIKKRPLYQNKTLRKVLLTVVLAVLFGAVGAVTFALVTPWAQERFQKEPLEQINIPEEEPLPSGETPVPEEEEEKEPIVITETVELGLEDYSQLFGKLRAVAVEAQRSLVTVTAGSSNTDWFNELVENTNTVSGLIVGNNGVEELILTNYSAIADADRLRVTFGDSTTVEAALKKYDRITDLAVVSVNLSNLSESTLSQLKDVTWGSSRSLRTGQPVIAIGSPAGISGSLLFGNLTAVNGSASAADGEYQLLLTDMGRVDAGNGVLINLSGEVIGWMQDNYLQPHNPEALTAYGISDMKAIIEHLCNNQDIVYLGIIGSNLTEEARRELKVPDGVYIKSVEMDSPAMKAGIQNGDILTEISGREVGDLDQMQELLLNFSNDQQIAIKVMRQGKNGYQPIDCTAALGVLK